MKVANTTMPVGGPGTVTAGTSSSTGTSAGLGDLFSLQMFQALQTMPSMEDVAVLSENMSEEDLKALEELMALIQQMLASGQNGMQELIPKLEEQAEAIDRLMLKAQGNFPTLTVDWKQLLTKLTQNEQAADEMEKLAALLEALKDQKGSLDTKRIPLLVRTEVISNASSTQQDSLKSLQPLRLNQGLSAYKAEAGIQAQTVQPSQQGAGLANQEGNEGTSLPFATPQGTVASSNTLQNNQTFQPTGPQTHTVHANQLTEQVTQIFVKQMKLTQVNGVHEAKLILNPQSLGQVDVTISSNNGVITAHFTAETQAGREMLDYQLPQLRAALTQQGLQVDRLEVNHQQAGSFDFQQQREQARQQHESEQQKQQQDEQHEFALDNLVDNTESTTSLWSRLRESSQGDGIV